MNINVVVAHSYVGFLSVLIIGTWVGLDSCCVTDIAIEGDKLAHAHLIYLDAYSDVCYTAIDRYHVLYTRWNQNASMLTIRSSDRCIFAYQPIVNSVPDSLESLQGK